jgi:hypothetical protein
LRSHGAWLAASWAENQRRVSKCAAATRLGLEATANASQFTSTGAFAMTQQKYMLIYRRGASSEPSFTPEQMQATLKQWTAWKEKFRDNVIDSGDALKPSGKVLKAGVLTDGPYVEAKEVLGGYSIIRAQSYEQAVEVASACPIAHRSDHQIEIRELAGF